MNSARALTWLCGKRRNRQVKLSWSLCLYGTPSMAAEAGLTLEEYWADH